ncbi:hypothetical protein RYA05_03730 [Pseudomonas syringae pv. actinidiae]|nr:hypothetical protein [Pseudomonas syringae pv. actinidiae]
MNLDRACLNYGSTQVPVSPSEITPLPQVFDFSDPVGCARKIFAVMSNASGGFRLSECRVRIHRERQAANLTCNGAHIYYRDSNQVKLTLEQAIAMHEESEVFDLGSVRTDQFGEGWSRAVWDNPVEVAQAS